MNSENGNKAFCVGGRIFHNTSLLIKWVFNLPLYSQRLKATDGHCQRLKEDYMSKISWHSLYFIEEREEKLRLKSYFYWGTDKAYTYVELCRVRENINQAQQDQWE